MATLDLSQAKSPVAMNDPNLVAFGAVHGTPSSTVWSYLTPAGHRVTVGGAGLTFDGSGRAVAGTATSVSIDIGNDGTPDLVLGGIGVPASELDDGPASFWEVLAGNDVILGPERAKGAPTTTFVLSGDGPAARSGISTGGMDVLSVGDGNVRAFGDVNDVGNPISGTPAADFRGGDDQVLGLVGSLQQTLSGDAANVHAGSRLTGGDDTILVQAKVLSYGVGDALAVAGNATLAGGDDYITGGKDFQGVLVGDGYETRSSSVVQGGDDTVTGGDLGEYVVGDVFGLKGGQLVGGDDILNGGGGNDLIAGEAWDVSAGSAVTGGNDLIRAGGGNDEAYGDAGYVGRGGNDTLYGDSGNDRLHGEGGNDVLDGGTQNDVLYGGDGNDWLSGGADNDTLYGDAGDDQLDGGSGADLLVGLTGNDTYYVNDTGDVVSELAGFGTDTVWSTLNTTTLSANVENLRFNGTGTFTGTGNELANTIVGGAYEDLLQGGGGNDTLIGGQGGDLLRGGDSVDTVSYATASAGVDARLLAGVLNQGDALGDGYDSIENLTGSDFNDTLIGGTDDNLLEGRSGNDLLVGYLGNDTLVGGAGSDILSGEVGNDVLRGGAQADVLQGYLGDDVFAFAAIADSTAGARDLIRGGGVAAFEGIGTAGGDRIDLSAIDANASVAGNQAFVFGGTGIGRVSVVDSGGNSLVRCNTDKDSAFELELVIEDGGALASAYKAFDFVL